MTQYPLLAILVGVALGCGSKDSAPAPAPGSAPPPTSGSAGSAPSAATAPSAGMSDAELRAAPLDACAVFSAPDVETHLGYRPEKVTPKPSRDITTSSGALDLRDTGCEWVNADTMALGVSVFLQLYRSDEEAARRLTARTADDLSLPDLGTEAFTSSNPSKASVVIYLRDRNRNYTVTVSALKDFQPEDARKRLVALLSTKF